MEGIGSASATRAWDGGSAPPVEVPQPPAAIETASPAQLNTCFRRISTIRSPPFLRPTPSAFANEMTTKD